MKITDKIKSMLPNKINKVASVQLTICPNGDYEFDYMIVELKQSKIIISNKESSVFSFNKVCKKIPSKLPVCLYIDGKGIINRIVKQNNSESEVSSHHSISKNEMYVQETKTDTDLLVSYMRIELFDSIINEFQKRNFIVISSSLGPFFINSFSKELFSSQESIVLKNSEIVGSENGIHSYRKLDDPDSIIYKIFDEKISSSYVIPYIGAIALLSGVLVDIVQSDKVKELKIDYRYKKIFQLGSKVALGVIAVILTLNFIFFNYYIQKQNEISGKYQTNEGLLKRLEDLQEELVLKEELIGKSGLTFKTLFSFYADQIATIVPANITLDIIDIYPTEKKVNQGDEIVFEKNNIYIKGQSKKSKSVNDMIWNLKKLDWIYDVVLLNYLHENYYSSVDFELKIIIK